MVKGDTEPIAVKKFENFREYLTIYPEYRCIFIGDNGQGDVRAAEIVLNDERYKHNLQRVYIHEIQPLYLTYAKKNITKSRDYDHICYFNTYVDAAIDAHHHKLIRSSGLRRIMEAALRDFEYIPLSSWLSKATDDGCENITASLAHTQFHSRQPPTTLVSTSTTTSTATSTTTATANMQILNQLNSTSSLASGSSTSTSTSISAPVFTPVVSSTSTSTSTALNGREVNISLYQQQRRRHAKKRLFSEESNRDKRARELNGAISKGNRVLSLEGFGSVRKLKFTARFAIGTPVVRAFREK